MRTWFSVKVKYAKETEEGLFKLVSEQYMVHAMTFTEAEARIYDCLSELIRGDFQVTHISKSNIVEVFYYQWDLDWFKAKVQYFIGDEYGKTKKVIQYMLVSADSVPQAHERIQESLSDMTIEFQVPDVVATKIVALFPYDEPFK
jgi:hypothetical protein